MIAHWDDVDAVHRESGHISGKWQSLTGQASEWVGVRRIRIDPGKWSTPLHLEGSEEEIFYVLEGRGVSVQWDGSSEEAYAVGPGDCLVHLALQHAHTLQAGPDGLDVLAYGQRHYAANTLLPRAGVSWLGPTWVLEGAPADHPWKREAAVGPPDVGDLAERPARIVNAADVEPETREGATVARTVRDLGRTAGSERTGLRLFDVHPGKLINPPHCHSVEEEIFVVLDGEGTLELWPHLRHGGAHEEHPVRRGSVVARPAGTGRAHTFRAGDGGLSVLAYGTREPGDVTYYPRSRKVNFRGIGLIGRVDVLDYWDGED
ncbi:MAG TPA: cupin domain-containing protein [Gaiella sp.]|nr:cupin domain-containing protein [Gaiella sp.]